jgi:EAL domain-containing protein (putative c-di-GMP-specific phosphodiesterase class I)
MCPLGAEVGPVTERGTGAGTFEPCSCWWLAPTLTCMQLPSTAWLRPSPRPSLVGFADPAGLRTLLRHRLARPTASIVALTLLTAAVLDVGDRALFSLLAVAAGGQVLVDLLLTRVGRPLAPWVTFRVVLATWPVALGALGIAGWTGDEFHGEAIAVVGLVVGGLVGLVEPSRFAAGWAVVSALSLVVGAAIEGAVTSATLITAASVGAGVIFGDQLRRVIEVYFGARRQIMHEASQVSRQAGDPFEVAGNLLQPLARWTPLKNPSLIWFRSDGRAVFLAVAGEDLPTHLRAGRELPDERNAHLRRQADQGPWVTGWAVQHSDGGYSQAVAALGINAGAYMPLLYEGRVLGLLAAGMSGRAGGHSTVTEYLPAMSELADAAAAALGPGLAALEQRSSAALVVEEVLERESFRPVFQPVVDLDQRRIVGFEALTRFDVPMATERLFIQAGLVGRLRDLEVATMRAAVNACRDLPQECWVSLNSSADLLVDTRILADIVRPVHVPVVIELSEHEVISDYRPITEALEQLSPDCSLAVDDAGAGFASLRHILEVRPAFVKLDLGLVQGVAHDPTRRALVAGFVHFARDAGFTLIAEGIEDRGDLRVLRDLGVQLGQGYLLGRPGRASEQVASPAPRPRRPLVRAAS